MAIDFADWLRNELLLQRRSQADVARSCAVERSTIARLVKAEREPLLSTASEIVEALGHELRIVRRRS